MKNQNNKKESLSKRTLHWGLLGVMVVLVIMLTVISFAGRDEDNLALATEQEHNANGKSDAEQAPEDVPKEKKDTDLEEIQESEATEEPESTVESDTTQETGTETENITSKDDIVATDNTEAEQGEPSDTPIEKPQKTYTFTEMNKTMYAKQSVNLRDLPTSSGAKVGSLKTGDAVTITGQCNETKWYRFEKDGKIVYVSNKYMTETKPSEETDSESETEREGYIWIPGFGWVEDGPNKDPEDQYEKDTMFDGKDFWDVINDPDNEQIGH